MARQMGMTAADLEERMSVAELQEHFADFELEADEVRAARAKAEKQAKNSAGGQNRRRRR